MVSYGASPKWSTFNRLFHEINHPTYWGTSMTMEIPCNRTPSWVPKLVESRPCPWSVVDLVRACSMQGTTQPIIGHLAINSSMVYIWLSCVLYMYMIQVCIFYLCLFFKNLQCNYFSLIHLGVSDWRHRWVSRDEKLPEKSWPTCPTFGRWPLDPLTANWIPKVLTSAMRISAIGSC